MPPVDYDVSNAIPTRDVSEGTSGSEMTGLAVGPKIRSDGPIHEVPELEIQGVAEPIRTYPNLAKPS